MKQQSSYGAVAIALHWLSAVLIALVLAVGWYMGDMPKGPDKLVLMGRHQSIGVAIAVLVLIRLLWRSVHSVPEMPLSSLMDKLAVAIQVILYGLMLVIPLLGYLTSSFGGHPVVLFGGVHVPLLTGLDHDVHELLGDAHQTLAYVMLGLIALHVAGALKHHFVMRDDVLTRMLPMLRVRGR